MSQMPFPSDPSRSLQVIGAGFSRTGTVSFTLAIEILLNGPVQHGSASIFREEAFIRKWIKVLEAKPNDPNVKPILKDIHSGYVGTTDLPAALYIRELVELYPEAKVICTVRDPNKWWKSLEDIVKLSSPWWIPYLFWPVPTLRWFNRWTSGIEARQDAVYPPGTKLGPNLLEIHHNYVRDVVPPQRLYFFSVQEGWEPLCKILGCPIPDEPFPHANDRLAIQEAFKGLFKKAIFTWAYYIGACGAGGFIIAYLFRRVNIDH